MLLHMPIASRSQTHEELFLEHYDWLFGWSLQMCGRSKERAEDLLHDLYIQLVQTRPELDTDRDRAKGYLYTMLRHLSISQARRTGREPMSRLRIVDYDSIEFGLSSVDRSGLIFVRSDLSRICEYACLRRKTSRAASTLILRFFLGYYPSELVRLLKTTRVSIDSSLRTARLEAKAYVERPTSIRFMGQEMSPEPLFPTPLPDEPAALFTEL